MSENLKEILRKTALAFFIIGGLALIADEYAIPDNNAIILTDEGQDTTNLAYAVDYLEPGKHSVLIRPNVKWPFADVPDEIIQIHCPEGYKFEGINIDRGVRYVLYTNTETVMVHPNGYDANGNPVYSDLGEVIEPRKDNTNNNIYEAGKHILAIPISNPSEDQIQVNYQEGYEAVDVAISTNGYSYMGGFIIYVNIEDVEVNDNHAFFGKPVEDNKKKTFF